ncbi:hypothetical protein Q5H92_21715 [Hymenobacter sp. M29]|uniref:Uncharacterized protein n=1 Tax=Hymenobacter mellowenesis TaxID=3063995 RepID=A0ABT9AGK0_9BACT|nr:hypothetical protein [Hymenobacter sp. M29]MDO7848997.1 hypothetical protein [Hymenobacter sp. M29]
MPALDSMLFYSANSFLSLMINRRFYNGQHYIWCSPVFNPKTLDERDPMQNIAVSSSPHHIYLGYSDSVKSRDRHSDQIERNRRGIKKGAAAMLAEKKITDDDYQRIVFIVDNAEIADFKPMLYVIPANKVHSKLSMVPVSELANPMGEEYRIFDLQDGEFDAIEFKF